MKFIQWIASILLIIGGLNWGLIGVADTNLVNIIFSGLGIEKLIYILVGIAAIIQAYGLCNSCGTSCKSE